jgi:hypothetical protein
MRGYATLKTEMQFVRTPTINISIVFIFAAALSLYAQEPAAPTKAEGIPARATPADYLSHAKAGTLEIAAEFTGHSIPVPEQTLTSEDYVAVEAAVFGPPQAHATLSYEDFSLRINGKKTPVTSQPYGVVLRSLKDPQLEPPASENKSKTSINGTGQVDSSTPAVFHVPMEVRHAWEQQVQKASLPLGDRPLPQAGLIFFPYRGKTEKIQSLELTYTSPQGSVTLALQP